METQTQTQIKSKLNVKFFFLCLGILITLITSVTSFLNLVFETLNKRFPDVLNASYEYGYSTYQYEGIRAALATLIIFFPVFLIVSYFWRKFIKGEMERVDEIIKKWVIYIILFLSSIVGIIDLVALVRYFISGEITTRFVLKVITVLIVVFLVGVYYITLNNNTQKAKTSMIFSGISILLVVFAVIYSFSIMGSPAKQRLLRLDDKRVGDLQSIQYQVINYWQQKEELPESLEILANPLTGYSLPVPPLFKKGEKYEYNVKSKLTFELCATFSLLMPKGWQEYGNDRGIYPVAIDLRKENASIAYPYPGSGINESWEHEAGRTCFERTIDKDIYPPFKD